MNCPRCGLEYTHTYTKCSRCGMELESIKTPQLDSDFPLAKKGDAYPMSGLIDDRQTTLSFGQYRVIEELENGGTSIHRVVEKDGIHFVLEQIPLNNIGAFNTDSFDQECSFLKTLEHSGLPLLVDYFAEESELYLLLSYHGTTTLFEFLYPKSRERMTGIQSAQSPNLPNTDQIARWARQLATTILYLHQQKPYPLVHGNISPSSIVVTNVGVCLLSFGFLRSVISAEREGQNLADKLDLFSDPHVQDLKDLSIQSDIFSYGRVIDFVLTGFIPSSRLDTPKSQGDLKNPGLDSRLKQLAQVVERCCKLTNTERYESMKDILNDLPLPYSRQELMAKENYECSSCGWTNRTSTRFCVRCGHLLQSIELAPQSPNDGVAIKISYDQKSEQTILNSYESGRMGHLSQFRLWGLLAEIHSDPGFDTLLCLDFLPYVDKLPHQQEAALRVLKEMRGRALLADEVGLGKTIEAGLVLKELLGRKLVESILIICPVQLLGQWQLELYGKFDELLLVMGRDIDTSLAWHCPRLIVPYNIIEQRFHAEEMLSHHYDLVILDEVHFLNDPQNWKTLRTIQNLRKKYFLLLSATPMHNDLEELYKIVTLLRPGHFDEWEKFRDRYVDEKSPTGTKNTSELRNFLQQVMIRNTRRVVAKDYPFPKRKAVRHEVEIMPEASDFYNRFRDFYGAKLKNVSNQRFLNRMGEVVERLSSSPAAFRELVRALRPQIQRQLGSEFYTRLEEFAANYPHELVYPKIKTAFKYAQKYIDEGHKVLIFSQFNETTKYAYEEALRTDLKPYCFLYDENKHPVEKGSSIREFRQARSGILFCPGEVSEGLNLQFASVMINLDLPWDPMKIEQRIGRIQRIGGQEEIFIVNLVLKETLEEEILRILEQKIRMFEAVVGKVEEIIGNLSDAEDFRTMISNLYLKRNMEVQDKETDEMKKVNPEVYIDQVLSEAVEQSERGGGTLNTIFEELLEAGDEEGDDDW